MSIPFLSAGERSSAPARLATLIGLGALLLGCARPVAVADGATIIDGSRHYHLWGIEVPGLHQSCAENGRPGRSPGKPSKR